MGAVTALASAPSPGALTPIQFAALKHANALRGRNNCRPPLMNACNLELQATARVNARATFAGVDSNTRLFSCNRRLSMDNAFAALSEIPKPVNPKEVRHVGSADGTSCSQRSERPRISDQRTGGNRHHRPYFRRPRSPVVLNRFTVLINCAR